MCRCNYGVAEVQLAAILERAGPDLTKVEGDGQGG